MAARVMVDTNILLYTYDTRQTQKQPLAAKVVDHVQALNIGGLSVQNLSEFFVTATRKLKPPLSLTDAAARVEQFTQTWEIFALDVSIVREAMRGVRDHQLHYWDALLWATAKHNEVAMILSEDFQHNQTLEAVRFVSPFHADFSLALLEAVT